MDHIAIDPGGCGYCAFCVGGFDSPMTRAGVCSTCNGLGWSPCLECLDTPGEVKRNCSECDHGHVCICHNCLGQGWPAGKIPCKRCAGEQRL